MSAFDAQLLVVNRPLLQQGIYQIEQQLRQIDEMIDITNHALSDLSGLTISESDQIENSIRNDLVRNLESTREVILQQQSTLMMAVEVMEQADNQGVSVVEQLVDIYNRIY